MATDQKGLYFPPLLNRNLQSNHNIQKNYRSESEILLENANEKLVHQKCIESFLIEVYKYLNSYLLIL